MILRLLTDKEEQVMTFLWNHKKPATSNEIKELFKDRTFSDSYLNVILVSLEKKKMIAPVGLVKYGKTYARNFAVKITREEYMARLMTAKGIDISTIPDIAVAMVKGKDGKSKKDEKTIAKIEEIISELKNG